VSTTPQLQPPVTPRKRNLLTWLSRGRAISLALLVFGIVALIWGAWQTRDSVVELQQAIAARHSTKGSQLVDLSQLQTAQRLATQATLPDEIQYAAVALRLADHEVDQAFSTALRESANSSAPGKQLQQVQKQIAQIYARIKEDDDRITALNAAKAKSKDPNDVQQDEDLAQAQLALDQDDLDDEKQVLDQAGNDRQTQLEQAQKQQQASEQKQQLPTPVIPGLHTFKDRFSFWQTLRGRRVAVQAGMADASSAAEKLLATRNEREASLEAREATAKSGQRVATTAAAGDAAPPQLSRAEAIAQLKALAAERLELTEYDRRITDLRELAANYDKWQALLFSRVRLELHYMLRALVLVLIILIAVIVVDAAVRRYFDSLPPERSRLRNLRVLLIALVQAAGCLLILIVIFGKPAQLYTFLGLIGAGLAVALKDFILGFIGWFFLMGRTGIRVGDWVEIQGVAGEVVEVGLLRTVLLETGNWTDPGHPTGRRVSFFNTFAVSGYYFNYTTHGQWMWDEIRIPLSPSTAATLSSDPRDAYQQLAEINRVLQEATADSSRLAEAEWRGVTTRYGIQHFSAESSAQLRPTATGMEVVLRYITRAYLRTTDRAQLYQLIVDALRQPETGPIEAPAAPLQS